MTSNYQILYGDIHNHNAVGYGVGSLERAIDIARHHLDFFSFTGHSHWHDMVPMEGGREAHWLNGFRKLEEGWPDVQNLIADANGADDFSAFLGFEWHSSKFGDQCVVFPEDHRPLIRPDDIETLRGFCRDERALMIPHHLAYPKGHRGVNWDVFNCDCSPVVEIFSEHGNSEDDRGAFPFFNHSMGGRETTNTVAHALDSGLRFGFVASSDSHSGFPGAYGEGLMAALVKENTRGAILDAIRERRTYALTGDRIGVDFTADGAPMGAFLGARDSVEIAYDVQGRDEMDVVEIISGGEIVHRDFAPPARLGGDVFADPVQLRLEWGWGPWGDLALERTCDWEMDVVVQGGQLLNFWPCLQSGPFDEERRHRVIRDGRDSLSIRSFTSRRDAYRGNPNQSAVLEISGDAQTKVALSLRQPVEQKSETSLADLAWTSTNFFTGPFPKEAYQWHRLVPLNASRVAGHCNVPLEGGKGHMYLRARQANGHLAWASPVFVG